MLTVYQLPKAAKKIDISPEGFDRMPNKESVRVIQRDVIEHNAPVTYYEVVK